MGTGNCEDHAHLIAAIEKGDAHGAAVIWRDFHWSFEVNENTFANSISETASGTKPPREKWGATRKESTGS